MPYDIRTTRKADDDIANTVDSLHRHVSAQSAAKWHSRVIAAIRSLATKPERCPLADEAAALGLEMRMLLFGRRRHVYRILFTIDGQTVNIHRVRDGAQDTFGSEDV